MSAEDISAIKASILSQIDHLGREYVRCGQKEGAALNSLADLRDEYYQACYTGIGLYGGIISLCQVAWTVSASFGLEVSNKAGAIRDEYHREFEAADKAQQQVTT